MPSPGLAFRGMREANAFSPGDRVFLAVQALFYSFLEKFPTEVSGVCTSFTPDFLDLPQLFIDVYSLQERDGVYNGGKDRKVIQKETGGSLERSCVESRLLKRLGPCRWKIISAQE